MANSPVDLKNGHFCRGILWITNPLYRLYLIIPENILIIQGSSKYSCSFAGPQVPGNADVLDRQCAREVGKTATQK